MLELSLKAWQGWGIADKPRLIKTFALGKNHHTGLIQTGNKKYVLKVFKHSLNTALTAQECAAQFGIAPSIFYRDDTLCLMEYVSGDIQAPLLDLANTLRKLHLEVECDAQGLDLMPFYQRYLQHAPENLQQQHTALLPILDEFINDTTPWCFCHNDLVPENCLSTPNGALLIDWEFAAKHNPWFDLAAVVLYRDLNLAEATTFLSAYRGWQHKLKERIYLSSQIALLWGDLLWHVARYGPDYQTHHASRFEQLTHLYRQITA